MMRRTLIGSLWVTIGLVMAANAWAASGAKAPQSIDWSHSGIAGTYDRAAAQRGYQVYREVCASCHGLKYVAFRNLLDIGFSEDEAKAIAADVEVQGGPDRDGEMFDRPAALFDYHPSPFPNDNAAKASNNGALPPDLSLIEKARAGGADYLYSFLIGFEDAPADVTVGEGQYYNPYFPGGLLSMPPALEDDLVEYADGTAATADQMARDVATFLSWAAEPKMEIRKRTGFKVIIFLVILSGLLYAAKRKVWANLH